MILRKNVNRHLKEKKFQFGGVIFLLLLSVMLYVSLSMSISTLETRNVTFKSEYNQEQFNFMTTEPVTEERLKELEGEYDAQLEERLYADVAYDSATLRVFSETETVNKPYVSEGEYPLKADEIALSPVFAEEHNLQIGDEINLKDREWTITGFFYLPDYIYMIERESDLISDASEFGIALGTSEAVVDLSNEPYRTVHGIGVEENQLQSLKQSVAEQNQLVSWTESGGNPRIQFVESEIDSSEQMITALPLFILALSVAMVMMLMKRRLEMQRKELGTLMALGYREHELMRHYMSYPIFIGLIGSLGGVVTGGLLSMPLTNLYSVYYNLPSISYFDFDPTVLVIGLIIPNLVLIAMSYWVIRKPLQLSPLSLLKPADMAKGTKSIFERIPLFQKGSFISRFRLRLLVRSKARLVYMVVGVVFSSVLLIFGFLMYNAMDQLVEGTYKDVMTYDYAVHYSGLQTEELSEGDSPFVSAEVRIEEVNGDEVGDADGALYGVEPGTNMIKLQSQADEVLNEELAEGFILSEPMAKILSVQVGDTIKLSNDLTDETLQEKVIGISSIYIGKQIYFNKSSVTDFLGYPSNSYTSKWTSSEPEGEENVLFIEDKQEVIQNFEDTSGLMRYSVFGIAAFAILIGVVVLTLLTNLVVEENSSTISLLKVLGYEDAEISKLIINVYTPAVVVGYLISIPLSMASLDGLMSTVVEETGFSFPVNLTWFTVVISFLLIFVTYFISMFFSRRKLKQVSLQEALKRQQD
ncbi:hypothetical protein N781_04355 [Pontibacillus halophilus JSM 076056 = DSM 19796]|uniref:ABC3 transporter permease C-terminal domain-containing protein n=1 Tax=Pontibacillus halophilus JSM 076056 = DSM 19796 TaxID=1385510 RepID=A0A0A5GJK8_9BACI|nr:FtsX-like permease family protein [Pontibacillus halophilus]KGX91398.1 hypothetical protein N781_04355 [Pontibacillus halophilus JSM 076056 = DSM 19796]